VEVDGRYRPVQEISAPQSQYVGDVTVEEWVQAFLLLSQSLGKMFEELNPTIYNLPDLRVQEEKIAKLNSWLGRKSSYDRSS
jgi:hypothetical protein